MEEALYLGLAYAISALCFRGYWSSIQVTWPRKSLDVLETWEKSKADIAHSWHLRKFPEGPIARYEVLGTILHLRPRTSLFRKFDP